MKLQTLKYIIRNNLKIFKPILQFIQSVINGRESSPKANARYSYSVWFRHILHLKKHNLNVSPRVIAELGPGDSIGVGLLGLLCGAKEYYALDNINYTDLEDNINILDDLSEMLKKLEIIPNEKEFPEVCPRITNYDFSKDFIQEFNILDNIDKRKNELSSIISKENKSQNSLSSVQYFAPWDNHDLIKRESVDLIFSQAVLEHVENLDFTYKAMSLWLKKGGLMSHQIDFQSHLTASEWNGHWTYSQLEWKILNANQEYSINREPLSTHLQLMKKYGFKVVTIYPSTEYHQNYYTSSILRNDLDEQFQNLTDEDLETVKCHVIAQKI